MVVALFLAFLLFLFISWVFSLSFLLIQSRSRGFQRPLLDLTNESLEPASLLIGWLLFISLAAIVLTSGLTVFTLVFVGLMAFLFFSPPSVKKNKPLIVPVLKSYFLLALLSFAIFYFLSAGWIDLETIEYHNDKYFYAQVGISLVHNGIESTNLGQAFSGEVAAYLPYHYLELWSAGITGMVLGLPVLLVHQYVIPSVALFLCLLFLRRLMIEKKGYAGWGIWAVIATLILVLTPKIPIYTSYIFENTIVEDLTKLMYIIVFYVAAISEYVAKEKTHACLFLFLAGATYFTVLPISIVLLGLIFILENTAAFTSGNFKAGRAIKNHPFLSVSLLLLMSYLVFIFLQLQTDKVNNFSGIDSEYNFMDGFLGNLSKMLSGFGRPFLSRYAIHTLLLFLLLRKLKIKAAFLLSFAVFLTAVLLSTLFYDALDGDQFFTNPIYAFLFSFVFFTPLLLGKKLQISTLIVLLIYASFYMKNYVDVMDVSREELCLIESEKVLFGTYDDPEIYLDPYLSNPALYSCGNYILNFQNKVPVAVMDFSSFIASEGVEDKVKSRLKMSFVRQYLLHNNATNGHADFLLKEIDEIVAASKMPFELQAYDMSCRNALTTIYKKAE